MNKFLHKPLISVVLDNIRSAINVGSIFRTCDGLNVEKIHLCGITAIPPNKELLKSALGATDSVSWDYEPDALQFIQRLKNKDHATLICVEQTTNSIGLLNFFPELTKDIILIFGNEIEGVNPQIIKLSDRSIEIPQHGVKHSYNVSVAAGIVIWDLYSKLSINQLDH